MYSVETRLKPTNKSVLKITIDTLQMQRVKKVPTMDIISFFSIKPSKIVGNKINAE